MLPNADKENEGKCNNLVEKLHNNNNITNEPSAEYNKLLKLSSMGNVHHGNLDILCFHEYFFMKYFSIFVHNPPYNKSILTFQWYLTYTIQITGKDLSKAALNNKPT
jgi:hypothetical protein